jgi:DNA mismatch repair ATPase MutS
MVPNDVLLTDVRLLIVSGSNMSGKSTLLRTVGINVVLALAGAPVRAERLALTRLTPGATLRIQDSLQAGRSRFFAEISRVRRIVDLADGTNLLFLLDELLQGTNSHDRAIGAAAVLRTLVARGAIGLITTHDLALTSMADQFEGRALNAHFEDHFDRGELAFDYRIRPGPVTRSNALELMRTVGLDVEEDPTTPRRSSRGS